MVEGDSEADLGRAVDDLTDRAAQPGDRRGVESEVPAADVSLEEDRTRWAGGARTLQISNEKDDSPLAPRCGQRGRDVPAHQTRRACQQERGALPSVPDCQTAATGVSSRAKV